MEDQGGFGFDLCRRNAALAKIGLEAPKPHKTGTTIAGVIFKVTRHAVGLEGACGCGLSRARCAGEALRPDQRWFSAGGPAHAPRAQLAGPRPCHLEILMSKHPLYLLDWQTGPQSALPGSLSRHAEFDPRHCPGSVAGRPTRCAMHSLVQLGSAGRDCARR